ncbi:MAG TPA: type II toxin-antitoxin system Phd/YefM family antitoxin [Rhizomicrobium sp.]|jgi:prevent-host-death family protein
MENKPRTINLRDANQQFSKLVREVEESGREFVILRNGKEAARLSPAKPNTNKRELTPEQEAALARLMAPKTAGTPPPGWKFNREEMWHEVLDEREARKVAREKAEKKAQAKAHKRG